MASRVVVDTSQLNKIVSELAGFEKQMPGAAISAINRTLSHVNSKLGRIVTSDYNLKISDVKSTITKSKAGKGRLRASLRSRGRRLTFSHFKISAPGKRIKSIRVKIKKSSGFKRIRSDPAAFIQTLSGRQQVMKRVGKKRIPVEVLRTLTVPQMIESLDVSIEIEILADKMLAERIEHEIDYRLKKVGAK